MQPLVDAWRGANPRIVKLWKAIERAAFHVIENRTSAKVGRIRLYMKEQKMFILLPSGRSLCYIAPHFTTNRFGSRSVAYMGIGGNHQWAEIETFGGKLAKNVAQAVARDLLAYAMQNVEAAGYPIVFHVHDEIVIEKANHEGSLKEVCDIMAKVPDWAEGLPLRADGYECAYYRKD